MYEAVLIAGDPQAEKGILWALGSLELLLQAPDAAPSVQTAHNQPLSNVRPVITHMFVSAADCV